MQIYDYFDKIQNNLHNNYVKIYICLFFWSQRELYAFLFFIFGTLYFHIQVQYVAVHYLHLLVQRYYVHHQVFVVMPFFHASFLHYANFIIFPSLFSPFNRRLRNSSPFCVTSTFITVKPG